MDLKVRFNDGTENTFRKRIVESSPDYGYAIIKHRWRFTGLVHPPDTCPFGDTRSTNPAANGKGHTIQIYDRWWKFIRKINSEIGYGYTRSVGNMIINIPYDMDAVDPKPPPQAESIGCGGDFLAYDDETISHIHAVSYNYLDDPSNLDPKIHNWENRPWQIWKACAIGITGRVINVANALDVYFPMISRTGFWVNKKYLEFLPVGPNYKFRGVNVYDGNTPLLTTVNGIRQFHTNWKINTLGVVPPQGWR